MSKKLLCIDYNYGHARSIVQSAALLGWQATIATDPLEAQRLLVFERYQAVFVDRDMPAVSGITFFRYCKEHQDDCLFVMMANSNDAIPRDPDHGKPPNILHKPFAKPDVRTLLEEGITTNV